jgi:hypothetical protein
VARKYTVDWSDQAFPEIQVHEPTEHDPGQTLAEAKREIIDHFTFEIQHARDRIAAARAVRASQIEQEEG